MGGTVSAMATPSRQDRAEAIARDIRKLFEAVGLPEWKTRPESTAGGYYISTYEGRVKLNWSTEAALDAAAGELWLDHRDHPVARLESAVTSVMRRAMADVLYAAGFTVTLVPGVPNRGDLDKHRDPELIVLAGPDFKGWSSG